FVGEQDLDGLEAVGGGGAEALQERHLLVDPGEVGGELGHGYFYLSVVLSEAKDLTPATMIAGRPVRSFASLRTTGNRQQSLTTETPPRFRGPGSQRGCGS